MMYLKLAWRNIWRNRKRTLITMSSVLFAVILSLFARSINEGTQGKMIENMVRFNTGYAQVQYYAFFDEPSLDNSFEADKELVGQIGNANRRIISVIPRLESFALAASEEKSKGAMVLGIDPDAEQQLNNLRDKIIEGDFFVPGEDVAVISEGLANFLNLNLNDTLVLIGQGFMGMSAAGKYHIKGIVKLPFKEMNDQLVYLSLETAQWLFAAEHRLTSLLIMPEEERYTQQVIKDVEKVLNEELVVLSWRQLMPELLRALEFDKVSDSILLLILYMVVGFGVFGTILTMTLERFREFGILLSVGMQRYQLAAVSFIETLMIAFGGVIGGLSLGFFVLLYFYQNPIPLSGDMADITAEYGIEPVMYFSLAPEVFYSQALVVFVIAMLISLYPVVQIFRLNILKAARR
jgi:putative ABC transport system permease protein